MTSGNSFSINMGRLQKDLLKRRMWVILLVGIVFLAIYPIRLALVISAIKMRIGAVYPEADVISAESELYRISMNLTNMVCHAAWPLVFFAMAAVFIAVQGFLFLFHRAQTDLYESLPVTRKKRFGLLYLNGILIFLITYAVSILLCIVILGATGTLNAWILQPFLFSILRDTLYFLSIYAITCACVMLAGNAFYALLLTAFVLVVPPLTVGMVVCYAGSFFRTYLSGSIPFTAPLNPFYHQLSAGVNAWTFYSDYVFSGELFGAYVRGALPHIAGMIICALIGTAAAYLLYLKRKSEWAETTICYHPVQTVFKVVSSALAAIVLTYFIYLVFYYDERTVWPYGRSILLLTAIAAVVCLAAEALYRRSVNAMFRNVIHVPVACLIAVLFFLVFRADVFGYDRFMPTQAGVQDAAITMTDDPAQSVGQYVYMSDMEGETNLEMYQFTGRYMHLTDIEAIADLMEESNRILRESNANGEAPVNAVTGEILFRLNNGREVKRKFAVAKDTDDALLKRVFDSKEYLEGVEQVYHDEGILREMNGKETLTFYSDKNAKSVNGSLYPEFADSYRADLEDHYSVLREKEDAAIGYVSYYDEGPSVNLQNGENYFSELRFPVYADDVKTIAFLKKYDMMYRKDEEPYRNLFGEHTGLAVEVEKYDTETEYRDIEYVNGIAYGIIPETYSSVDSKTATYDETDTETRKIFAASVCEAFLSPWFDQGRLETGYSIYVSPYQKNPTAKELAEPDEVYDVPVFRRFYQGKVPAEVEAELAK